ncbi:Uncharacterised protein [Mycobacteroides abscessus]|nr:Uncharacterised protein [Mycobacteroides abscessus]
MPAQQCDGLLQTDARGDGDRGRVVRMLAVVTPAGIGQPFDNLVAIEPFDSTGVIDRGGKGHRYATNHGALSPHADDRALYVGKVRDILQGQRVHGTSFPGFPQARPAI